MPRSEHPPKKLRNKFIFSFAILTLFLMIFVVGYVDIEQKKLSLEQAKEHGLSVAENIAAISTSYLLTYDYVSLTKAAEQAARRGDIRYVIILDKEERVAAWSGHPQKQGEKLSDNFSTEILKARQPTVIQSQREGERALEVSLPVFIEGSDLKWGTVLVGVSLERIYQNIYRTRLTLITVALLALTGVIIISILLSSKITKPVEKLVEATISASSGKFDHYPEIHTGDEIEHLTESFNSMMREILSQRLEIEEKLRYISSLQNYNHLVLESMPSGLLAVDLNGKITMINKIGKEMLGLDRDNNFMELDDRFSELKEEIRASLAAGKTVFNRQLSMEIGDRKKFLDLTTSLIKDEERPTAGTIAVFHDVTEIKELQEKLQAADRMSAIGTVASGIAHDVRNPLSAIKTFVQMLPFKKADEEFLQQFNITVPRELDRINRTIENLLQLTRKPQMQIQELNINSLLDQVIEICASQIPRNRIEVLKYYSPSLPKIMGDIEYLNRAFSNLLVNAIQAIQDRGKITISTVARNNQVIVSIHDTGIGMDAKTARNIFNPYFTTKRKGSGLGLPIVLRVIEEHGGKIEFESRTNQGTTFLVYLPILYPRPQ